MNPPVDEKWLPEDNGTGEGGAMAGNFDVPSPSPDGVHPATAEAVPGADAAPGAPVAVLQPRLRRMTRRGFAWGGVAAVAGLAGWRWVVTRSEEGGLPWPLRRVLELNERLARGLTRDSHLSPEFPRTAARMPRVNGSIGLESELDASAWRLRVVGSAGEASSRTFTLDEIKGLPRVEMTTELRCIEGWSEVVHWAGARLADLASATGLATRGGRVADPAASGGLLDYAALETPDGDYYVGLDMASALHPQTLLCYEMDGQPLTPQHGAPLRLVIPLKYGIKNLKRIGTIRFTDVRPADYWAERGYDWYAGH
jgi:DMSO/TMAO reductase YedYZ molybdopterin-dependent catalytic subunit